MSEIEDQEPVLTAQEATLRQVVATFPERPGIYLMKNKSGEILYIGKALNLRSRVRSYLGGGDGRRQIPALMMHVAGIEVIVCESETQALILERDLIGRHKPLFNVKLKDDRAYLRVRVDTTHEWPRIDVVRYPRLDGAQYFGPYISSHQLREVLDVIRRVLPLRTCSDVVFYNRQRPCLEYQIKRCCGPCCLPVQKEEYESYVNRAIDILEGRAETLIPQLEGEMDTAAAALDFERAALLRDRVKALEGWIGGHKNVYHRGEDRHAFGVYCEGDQAVVTVLHTREGRIAFSKNFVFENVQILDEELLATAIEQYYGDGNTLPPEILIPFELDAFGLLEESLSRIWLQQGNDAGQQRCEIRNPKRGVRLRLLELAQLNAKSHFTTRFRAQAAHTISIRELKKVAKLRQMPRLIECMDISNTQGSHVVGAVVSFLDGVPNKEQYRTYHIQEAGSPDDFAAIYEVTHRRLKSAVESGEFPDLLIIDGGRIQLASALRARDELGLDQEIISIAKIRENVAGLKMPERLFIEGQELPLPLKNGEPLTFFLQRIRDEVHRFVLTFHRKTRAKAAVSSSLDTIPGIGPARRKRLLSHFGGLDRITASSAEDVARVGKMSVALATTLLEAIRKG